jgi:hypothetical protein
MGSVGCFFAQANIMKMSPTRLAIRIARTMRTTLKGRDLSSLTAAGAAPILARSLPRSLTMMLLGAAGCTSSSTLGDAASSDRGLDAAGLDALAPPDAWALDALADAAVLDSASLDAEIIDADWHDVGCLASMPPTRLHEDYCLTDAGVDQMAFCLADPSFAFGA